MGFDVKAALLAAGQVVKTGGDIADTTVRTINSVQDGRTDREIRLESSKTDQVLRYIDAGKQALSTVASIYATISQSINDTKEVNNKIQESRNKFELDKKKLDNDFEEMKIKYQLEESKISDSHEEKMEKMRLLHEEEMRKIDTIREVVLGLMTLLNSLALNYPDQIQPYMLQVSSCLSSIKTNNNNLLEG